ncbi:MAG: LysR family transcriptional regulator [Myxococcota bacterium]
MPPEHLHTIDLNLLTILRELLRERHITRAGSRLGMTQSGTSRALGRLRALFGDPLLVRQGRSLQLTPRAERLMVPLEEALAALRGVLEDEHFEPSKIRGPIHVGMPDHLALILGPRLLGALHQHAPGCELVAHAFSKHWREELIAGHVEMAFGVLGGDESGLRRRTVFHDPWVVLLRHDHPALRKRWTIRSFVALDHGLMGVRGAGPSQVDRALAERGYERRVVFRATSPVVVAMFAAESDIAVTTTRSLATYLVRHLPLSHVRLPVDAEPLQLPLVWHERDQHDPRHRWLREQVAATTQALLGP